MSKRAIIASAGAAVMLATGAGGAYAAGGFGGGSGPGEPGGPATAVRVDFGGPPGPPGDVEFGGIFGPAVASYLGLSESELRTQLEAGKTLAQIAAAQGKSVSGLKDVIYAEAKSKLDQAVANGKVTESEAQTMLADLKSHLDDIVNETGPPGGSFQVGVEIFGPAVAGYLGLSESELRTQLEAGQTLAQIAAAQGRSVDGLKDVIYAKAKSELDQAVADGKLTASQEQTMLAKLESNLDDIVNRTGPPEGKEVGGVRIVATAVAGYLGLSEDELRTQVESGKSLAEIATDQGKSVDGLKAAILADAKDNLDQAVAAGKLTDAQAKAMLAELTSHVDDLVNGKGPIHRRA
jgi:polyhydroxyalkanoate synthesis regulator phasin